MSRFSIKKAPTKFEIQYDTFDSFLCKEEREKHLEIPCEKLSDDGVAILYFLPSAFVELDKHISWKMQTQDNLSEQGGILVGNVYKDKRSQSVCGVVQHIIPSARSGNATYIQFSHEDWILMYREFEEKYSFTGESEKSLNILGWYHTHPNMPVNMSGIDKNTHTGFFHDLWQFSVVINPQQGIWAVFNGKECKNCNGYIYSTYRLEDKSLLNVISRDNLTATSEDDKQTTLNQTITVPGESFVIKRKPLTAQNNIQHEYRTNLKNNPVTSTSSYLNSDNVINKKRFIKQPYKGEVLLVDNSCYYCPLNELQQISSKNYLITDTLVRQFTSFIDSWEFVGKESIALICNTVINKKVFVNKTSTYYNLLSAHNYLSIGEIIYDTGSGGWIEYMDSKYKRNVSVIVLYAVCNKNYSQLCEMFGNYDCLLWINPCNINEFEFYVFDKSSKRSANIFNIKKRKDIDSIHKEQNLSNKYDKSSSKRVGDIRSNFKFQYANFPSSISDYWETEHDSILVYKPKLFVNQNIIATIFQYINRYSEITGAFGLILSFALFNDVSHGRNILYPWTRQILQAWIFRQNENGELQNIRLKFIKKRTFSTSKFAILISNRDVNINEIKYKISDHLAAICVNIETQICHFYRIF